MLHPSAHRSVGKVSNPSDKQRLSINFIPCCTSGRSDREKSLVHFVYDLSNIIHQNPESTGATLPIALPPKSAINVSFLRCVSYKTLKLAGITPSPRVKLSILFSQPWRCRVFNRKFFTISGSGGDFIKQAKPAGKKSLTKTCTSNDGKFQTVRDWALMADWVIALKPPSLAEGSDIANYGNDEKEKSIKQIEADSI